MSEAPERIWATGNDQFGVWNDYKINPKYAPPQTEYIRADHVNARVKQAREDALREAGHLMPRYFGVWSATGVHIGVWDDGATAAKVLWEYPGGVARDLIDAADILAFITKDQTNG